MTDEKNKNLFYLHDLSGYKVADDYPDVRGWEVKDAGNRTVGKVDGLLVNKDAERVVYLDVELDEDIIEAGHETYASKASDGVHEFLNEDGESHLIVPIGIVQLNEENKTAHAAQINYETFAKTSRFSKGTDLDRDYELIVFSNYFPSFSDEVSDEDGGGFYKRKEFDNKWGRS